MLNDHENIAATQQEIVSETLEEELQRRCSIIDQVIHIIFYLQLYQTIHVIHLSLGQM